MTQEPTRPRIECTDGLPTILARMREGTHDQAVEASGPGRPQDAAPTGLSSAAAAPTGPPTRISVPDLIASAVLFVALCVAALGAFYASAFFVMATDSCFSACDTTMLTIAYAVTWACLGAGVLGAPLGAAFFGRRWFPMFVWPLLGVVVVVLGVLMGSTLAAGVSP